MYKDILQHIDNIAVWPMISFIIFFFFFLCLLGWVFSVDKRFIDEMKGMPLDEHQDQPNTDSKNLNA